MLHQNWFMDKRFEMFEDYGESQSFYDTETKNIYVVFEERGACPNGSTVVQEITEESIEYQPNIQRYEEWKRKKNSGWHKSKRDSLKYISENGNEYWTASLYSWQSDIKCTYDIVALFLIKYDDDGICKLDKMIDYCCGEDYVGNCKEYFEKAIQKYESGGN